MKKPLISLTLAGVLTTSAFAVQTITDGVGTFDLDVIGDPVATLFNPDTRIDSGFSAIGIVGSGQAYTVNINSTGGPPTAGITGVLGTAGIFLQDGGTVNVVSGAEVSGGTGFGRAILIENQPGTVVNSGTISARSDAIEFEEGGTVTNNAGGTITSSFDEGIFSEDGSFTLINSGTVSGFDKGVFMESNSSAHTFSVTNNSGGLIRGITDDALEFDADGSIVIVLNNGTITGLQDGVLIEDGVITSFTNNGSITGGRCGVDAVNIQGSSVLLNNAAGTITGDDIGMDLGSDGNTVTTTNHGSVTATDSNGDGVFLRESGHTLNNFGTVTGGSGAGGHGVEDSDGGNTITNNVGGMITGNIGVFLDGSAATTFNNFGTIESTGTTAISVTSDSSIVNLGTGSNLMGVMNATGTGDVINLEGTVAGEEAQMTGFDTLNMNGTSWTLTNTAASNFTNLIDVTAGILIVNGTGSGTLSADNNVNVQSGATLKGTGTLGSSGGAVNILSGGTHAPGNSIGTQTINPGNYVLNSGATLEIEFNNSSEDLVDVTAGNVTLESGSIVKPIPYGVLSVTDRVITFSQASGTFTDNGVTIDDSHPLIDTAVYTPDGQITITGNSIVAANEAEQQIIDILNGLGGGATGELLDAINQITSSGSLAEIATNIKDLSPDVLGHFYQLSQTHTHLFSQSVRDRLSYLHAEYSRSGDGPLLAHSCDGMFEAMRSLDLLKAHRHRHHCGWQGYAGGFYNYSELDTKNGFDGYDSNAGGVNVGIDRFFGPQVIFGLAFNGTYNDFDIDNDRGSGDMHGYIFSPYAGIHTECWYVDANIGYGVRFFDIDRCISAVGATAHSSFTVHEFLASVHGGYAFGMLPFSLILTTGFDFSTTHHGTYAEQGAGTMGVCVDSDSTQSLHSNLGLKVAHLFDGCRMPILLELGGAWRHQLLDRNAELSGKFNGSATGFSFQGSKPNRASAHFYTRVVGHLDDLSSLSLGYDGEFNNLTMSHTANLTYHRKF